MESDIELKINFRFLELTEKQAAALKISKLGAKFGTHFKSQKPTGVVPLNKNNIDLISNFIKENEIPSGLTDIFISFVTEYDTRTIDIPDYVNQVVKELGSKIVVSYAIV